MYIKFMSRLVVAVFLVVFIFFYYLYNFWGLDCYLRARKVMSQLSQDKVSDANNEFYGDPSVGLYSGTLAKVNYNWLPGIWIWTNGYLRYFKVTDKTVYTTFDACIDGDLSYNLSRPGEFQILPSRTFDLTNYGSGADKCDFLKLRVYGDGLFPKIAELWSHDWWPFMKSDMSRQCKK